MGKRETLQKSIRMASPLPSSTSDLNVQALISLYTNLDQKATQADGNYDKIFISIKGENVGEATSSRRRSKTKIFSHHPELQKKKLQFTITSTEVKQYKKSADQGNAEAQHNLGYCLQCGIGIKKDEEAAVTRNCGWKKSTPKAG